MDGIATIYNEIEDMAAHYVKEIQAIHPEGPYFLSGATTGGNIAYEMAQQLISQGKNVGALILIEPVIPEPPAPPPHFSNYLRNLSFYLRRAMRYMKKREVFMMVRFFLTKIIFPRLGRNRGIRHDNLFNRNLITEIGIPGLKIWRKTFSAINRYVFDTFPCRTVLYVSEKNVKFPGNPQIRINPWIKFVDGPFEAYVVPGQHLEILEEPNVQFLAQHLKKYLNKELIEDIH